MTRFFSPCGEVKSAFGKWLVAVFVVIVLMIFGPLMLILHKPLRWLGRNGFYFDRKIHLGLMSFRRIDTA